VARNGHFDGFSPYLVQLICWKRGQKEEKKAIFWKQWPIFKNNEPG
jgi:hypothetical protein